MNACEALLLLFYGCVALVVAAEVWTAEEENIGIVDSLATGVFWLAWFGIILGQRIVIVRREIRQAVTKGKQ